MQTERILSLFLLPLQPTSRTVPQVTASFFVNLFLDELNRCQDLIKSRSIEVALIAGIGKSTIQYLQKDRSSLTQLWDTNTSWSTINSQAGDGNVMASSVFVLYGDQHLVEGGHKGRYSAAILF
jgi:hypothetical protein